MVYNLRFFPLQNAVCFIILTYLVPVLFTFYIQGVLKLKKNNSGPRRLRKIAPSILSCQLWAVSLQFKFPSPCKLPLTDGPRRMTLTVTMTVSVTVIVTMTVTMSVSVTRNNLRLLLYICSCRDLSWLWAQQLLPQKVETARDGCSGRGCDEMKILSCGYLPDRLLSQLWCVSVNSCSSWPLDCDATVRKRTVLAVGTLYGICSRQSRYLWQIDLRGLDKRECG